MADVLKGNFTPKQQVSVNTEKSEDIEKLFEEEAMKNLGGSIAFVSKKKVKWNAKIED